MFAYKYTFGVKSSVLNLSKNEVFDQKNWTAVFVIFLRNLLKHRTFYKTPITNRRKTYEQIVKKQF